MNQQYLKRGRCLGWRHVADIIWISLNDRVHDRQRHVHTRWRPILRRSSGDRSNLCSRRVSFARGPVFDSSPVLFAPKKDGKLRLCIDYHRLNQQTERDPSPTPVVADLIASTRGTRMFSKLDLKAEFHQLRLQDGDQEKTAFSTPFGLFEWVTCPFGLANTPD